jgi:hypothetical protein
VITAYCDACGDLIPAEFPAGIRLVIGKQEWTWHLCERHQRELREFALLQSRGAWRVVK